MILVNLMMKTNSKILNILIALLVAGLLIPGMSLAMMNSGQIIRQLKEQKDTLQTKLQNIKNQHQEWQKQIEKNNQEELASRSTEIKNRQASICEKLASQAVGIDQIISDREVKIQEKQTEITDKLAQKRETRDIKLEQHRNEWEEQWGERFTQLEEKASTSEEKQALVEFKSTVQEAIASRQAAVDKAISDFRVALDKIIADRKTATDTAKTNYVNAYDAAIQKAQDDCTNGVDANTIRATLKADLKAAKDKFNSDRKVIDKMDLKPLVDVRQQAFKEALDYFKKVMEAERTKLKAVFGA